MVDYNNLLPKQGVSFGQKFHSRKAHSILIDIYSLIIRKKKHCKFHVVRKPCSVYFYLLTICVVHVCKLQLPSMLEICKVKNAALTE